MPGPVNRLVYLSKPEPWFLMGPWKNTDRPDFSDFLDVYSGLQGGERKVDNCQSVFTPVT